MQPLSPTGHRACGTRPETASQIIRRSRRDFRAALRIIQEIRHDIAVSHEADGAYQMLTEGVKRCTPSPSAR